MTLTPPQLVAALRAQAAGDYPHEAAVELIIGHDVWLRRRDFTLRCVSIETDPELVDQPMAGIDWRAAAAALDAGELPSSSSEASILRVAASLGAGVLVDLADVIVGLDRVNIARVARAVLLANGRRHATVTVAEPSRWPPAGPDQEMS